MIITNNCEEIKRLLNCFIFNKILFVLNFFHILSTTPDLTGVFVWYKMVKRLNSFYAPCPNCVWTSGYQSLDRHKN